MNKIYLPCFILISFIQISFSQNYNFNFNTNGQRVCLAESNYISADSGIRIMLSDHAQNNIMRTDIFRRPPDGLGNDWVRVAASLQPGTSEWIDQEVTPGSKYEYQIRRNNSWNYGGNNYDATGYTLGCAMTDNSGYQGRMILLVAENIVTELSAKFQRLKSELTGDGWKVEVMIVPRAEGWDNGAQTLSIKKWYI